jgi:hypothetical protein
VRVGAKLPQRNSDTVTEANVWPRWYFTRLLLRPYNEAVSTDDGLFKVSGLDSEASVVKNLAGCNTLRAYTGLASPSSYLTVAPTFGFFCPSIDSDKYATDGQCRYKNVTSMMEYVYTCTSRRRHKRNIWSKVGPGPFRGHRGCLQRGVIANRDLGGAENGRSRHRRITY